jgi:hypothetical protein
MAFAAFAQTATVATVATLDSDTAVYASASNLWIHTTATFVNRFCLYLSLPPGLRVAYLYIALA